MKHAIYFSSYLLDEAVERGLISAGCRIQQTRNIPDTINELRQLGAQVRSARMLRKRRTYEPSTPILIADVQSGGLALLEMIKQERLDLPPTMLVDREGRDIQVPLRALQHGVRDYLLPEDNSEKREKHARQLVEKHSEAQAKAQPSVRNIEPARRLPMMNNRTMSYVPVLESMRWDPDANTIHIGDADFLQLSPVEGRTFDLLFNRRGDTVSIPELIECTLGEAEIDPAKNIQLLRTHLARLRRRLADHPRFGYRIENMRGSGYTLI